MGQANQRGTFTERVNLAKMLGLNSSIKIGGRYIHADETLIDAFEKDRDERTTSDKSELEIIDMVSANESFYAEMGRNINIGMTSLKEVITNTPNELKFINDDKGNLCSTKIEKLKKDYSVTFQSDNRHFENRILTKEFILWEWEYNFNGLYWYVKPNEIQMFDDYVPFPDLVNNSIHFLDPRYKKESEVS